MNYSRATVLAGGRPLCSRGDGRLAFRAGLCQRCYRAEPHAPRAAPGEGRRLPGLHLPAPMLEASRAAAQASGMTVPQWLRALIERALERPEPP